MDETIPKINVKSETFSLKHISWKITKL
jgi:hypothetical protein